MNKWTSIKDGLPQKPGKYLTYWPDGDLEVFEFEGVLGEFGWAAPNGKHGMVTHWMPLPEPPKGGE